MFTYVGLIQLTPEGRENLEKTPEYLDRIRHIVEEEGGVLEHVFAMMGPWPLMTTLDLRLGDAFAAGSWPRVGPQ